jgi:hypothetical protein
MSQSYSLTMSIDIRKLAKENGHYIAQMRKTSPGRWTGHCEKCGMEAKMRINPEGKKEFTGQALRETCDG